MNITKSYCFLFRHPSKDLMRNPDPTWRDEWCLSVLHPWLRRDVSEQKRSSSKLLLLTFWINWNHLSTPQSVVLSGCLWKSLTCDTFVLWHWQKKPKTNKLCSCGFHMQMCWLHGWPDTGTQSQGPSYMCLQKHSKVCLWHWWHITEHLLSALFE